MDRNITANLQNGSYEIAKLKKRIEFIKLQACAAIIQSSIR